jgi:hypothetical protein
MGQKHLIGVISNIAGNANLLVSFCTEFGYDSVISIEDVTDDSKYTQIFSKRNSRREVILSYASTISGARTLKVYFSSGEVKTLNVLFPKGSIPSYYSEFEYELTVDGNWNDNSAILNVFNPLRSQEKFSIAALPILDPLKRFNSQEVVKVEGLSINKNTFGTVAPIAATQFVNFFLSQGDFNSPAEVLNSTLASDASSATCFIWAEGLKDVKDSSPTFEVCLDPTSSTYYLTSGDDSQGNAIPDIYLEGSAEAIFTSGVCNVGSKEFNFLVAPSPTIVGTDASVTLFVAGIKASPKQDPWIEYDPLLDKNKTSYPAISGLSFEFKLVKPTGVTVTTGVISSNTTTFSSLPASKLPYEAIAIDQDSGETTKIKFLIGDKPFGTFTTISNQTYRNCRCTILAALNSANTGAEAEADPCRICYTCNSAGNLLLGGTATAYNLLDFTTTLAYNASSPTTADGSVTAGWVFNPNLSQDVVLGLAGATYDIFLFKSNSQTGPFTSQVGATVVAHTLPSYTISSLTPGLWYQMQVKVNGETCISYYTFFIGPEEDRVITDCLATVDYTIDPCTGALGIEVLESAVSTIAQYIVYINGVGVSAPYPNVNVGDSILVKIQLEECKDLVVDLYDVTEADLNCQEESPFPTGCMDPGAVNFDPTAIIDNGTCVYGIVGCMDALSTNYNPNATISDDSCIDLCSEDVVVSVTVTNNIPTTTFIVPQVNYSLTYYSPVSGFIETIYDLPTGPFLEDGVYIVTFMSSLGCTEETVVAVNTDINYGCTDPFAENFSAFANLPMSYWTNVSSGNVGEECTYSIVLSPCVPKEIDALLKGIDKCLAIQLDKYFNMIRRGNAENCATKDIKKAILIRTLMRSRGLKCLYNCADSLSLPYSPISCNQKWLDGGPSGSELIFDITLTYSYGDVVKHESGYFYTFTGLTPTAGDDPELYSLETFWTRCTEPSVFDVSVNRLDSYLEFLDGVCSTCNINIKESFGEPVSVAKSPNATDKGEITIGGEQLDFNT